MQQAFPGARSERSIFVLGVRHCHSTSAGHEVGALSLPVGPVQAQEVSTLQTRNAALLQRVSELEAQNDHLLGGDIIPLCLNARYVIWFHQAHCCLMVQIPLSDLTDSSLML